MSYTNRKQVEMYVMTETTYYPDPGDCINLTGYCKDQVIILTSVGVSKETPKDCDAACSLCYFHRAVTELGPYCKRGMNINCERVYFLKVGEIDRTEELPVAGGTIIEYKQDD